MISAPDRRWLSGKLWRSLLFHLQFHLKLHQYWKVKWKKQIFKKILLYDVAAEKLQSELSTFFMLKNSLLSPNRLYFIPPDLFLQIQFKKQTKNTNWQQTKIEKKLWESNGQIDSLLFHFCDLLEIQNCKSEIFLLQKYCWNGILG